MDQEMQIIQSTINQFQAKDLGDWLFLRSSGDDFSKYGDVDLFLVFTKQRHDDFYKIADTVSHLACDLTIILKKYVSIYPIEKSVYDLSDSQFVKNLKSMKVDL